MGNCGCDRGLSPDQIVDKFWAGTKLKETQIADLANILRAKLNSEDEITSAKFEILVNDCLKNNEYHEQSHNIFKKALNDAKNSYNNEGYLFLSTLFLSIFENNDQFIKEFISLSMINCGLKDDIESIPLEDKNLINKSVLQNLIQFYINMISLLSVEYLSNFSDNPQLFVEVLSNDFSLEKQTIFIEEFIFKEYQDTEKIDILEFFKSKLTILRNDVLIREKICGKIPHIISK